MVFEQQSGSDFEEYYEVSHLSWYVRKGILHQLLLVLSVLRYFEVSHLSWYIKKSILHQQHLILSVLILGYEFDTCCECYIKARIEAFSSKS